MTLTRALPLILAMVATSAFAPLLKAQKVEAPSPAQPAKVRHTAQRPMLFSPGPVVSPADASVEFRPYDRMTEHDRNLAADAESAIGERAGVAGLEFNVGNWVYQQVVCSALPNHLFLQFTRNNGKGDVSVFSASVPRGGEGRVRIIPILRRGYSLFSPAPINALTISAFNHIRAEEHPDTAPEWLATGMCYAALAGAHPAIGPPDEPDPKKLPASPPATLLVPNRGGAVIHFKDVSVLPSPKEWTMTFDAKGKLMKASHSAAPQTRQKVIQQAAAEVPGKPVKAADPQANTILIK